MSTQAIIDRKPSGMALGGVLLLAIFAAACGGGAVATIPTGPGSSTSASAAATPVATPVATAVATPRVTPRPTPTPNPPKVSVAGTITWNATFTGGDHTTVARGSMHLVLDEDLPREFTATRGRSTYEFDYERSDCTPSTHKEGTFETSVGGFAEPGFGRAFISGLIGHDLEIHIWVSEQWMALCECFCTNNFAMEEDTLYAFPGCDFASGEFPAVFDGVSSYRISCDTTSSWSSYTATGHIEGNLSPTSRP